MKKMKRLLALTLVLLLGVTAFLPATNVEAAKKLSTTKVRQIVRKNTPALKNRTLYIESDYDDGILVYEVEGSTASRHYTFEVNAYSGRILEKSWEARGAIKKGTKNLTTKEARDKISKEVVAKKYQTYYRIKTDYEDGVKIYEVDVNSKNKRYEMEINATTGKFIEVSWEVRNK